MRIRPLILLAACSSLSASADEYQPAREAALASLGQLEIGADAAEKAGIEVSRERVTLTTAREFLKYADWDHRHPEELEAAAKAWWKAKDRAAPYSHSLPTRELHEVKIICDQALAKLKKVVANPDSRRPVPTFDTTKARLEGEHFYVGDRPYFPGGFTWMPEEDPGLLAAYGRIGSATLSPGQKRAPDKKAIAPRWRLEAADGSPGYIFFKHGKMPDWLRKAHPGVDFASRRFTDYDIDHPETRKLWSSLLANVVPELAGHSLTRAGYLLANEPHWFTATDEWDTGPVSEFTFAKFRTWLKTRHGNAETLNKFWGSNFGSFAEVKIEIPIDRKLRGTPMWYDWCRFNMDRVTEYFSFLKQEIVRHDPDARVHIKIIPGHFSESSRSHGMDMEALVRLQDIIGCDAKILSSSPDREKQPWLERYGAYWQELAFNYDFYKSISPEKMIFDSEFHSLSTVHWRDEDMSAGYVNSVWWLAHLHGMGMNQTWWWGRDREGKPLEKDHRSFFGSNLTQPLVMNAFGRVMKDLNAFGPEIVALSKEPKHVRVFYSEAAAINSEHSIEAARTVHEKLYHDGFSIGFATGRMLRESGDQLSGGVPIGNSLVIASGVKRVTKDELDGLASYLAKGGQLLLIGSDNFSSDEYGRPRPQPFAGEQASVRRLPNLDGLNSAVHEFRTAKELLPKFALTESNPRGAPTCLWRIRALDDRHLILAINLGNQPAKLTVSPNDDAATVPAIHDLLTSETLPASFSVEALGVRLLESR